MYQNLAFKKVFDLTRPMIREPAKIQRIAENNWKLWALILNPNLKACNSLALGEFRFVLVEKGRGDRYFRYYESCREIHTTRPYVQTVHTGGNLRAGGGGKRPPRPIISNWPPFPSTLDPEHMS